MQISCPNCQKHYELDDRKFGGRKVKCQCGTAFHCPETAAENNIAVAPVTVSETAFNTDIFNSDTPIPGDDVSQMQTLISDSPSDVGQQMLPEQLPQVPGYQMTRLLGRGGMGAVFEAVQTKLNRSVAVKFLYTNLSQNENHVKRFQREIEILAKLDHQNIVKIIDSGIDQNPMYYVMEYVKGKDDKPQSLKEILKKGKLSPDEVVRYGIQIAKGLQHAHEQGVIHRDIKPDNILVDQHGFTKVTDFGIAGIQETAVETQVTMEHTRLGTLDYMPPEQQTNAREADGRADIYSFGVVLYQMLTGQLPKGRFSMPSELIPGLPYEWDNLIDKMLRQDPSQRLQTMGEVIERLETIQANTSFSHGTNGAGTNTGKMVSGFWNSLGNKTKQAAVIIQEQLKNHKPQANQPATTQMETSHFSVGPAVPIPLKQVPPVAVSAEYPDLSSQILLLWNEKKYYKIHTLLLPYQHNLPEKYQKVWAAAQSEVKKADASYRFILEKIQKGNLTEAQQELTKLQQLMPDYDEKRIELLRRELFASTEVVVAVKELEEQQRYLDAETKLRCFLADHPNNKDFTLLPFILKIEAGMKKFSFPVLAIVFSVLAVLLVWGQPHMMDWVRGNINKSQLTQLEDALLSEPKDAERLMTIIGYVPIGVEALAVLCWFTFVVQLLWRLPANIRRAFVRFRLRNTDFGKSRLSKTVWYVMLEKEWKQIQSKQPPNTA